MDSIQILVNLLQENQYVSIVTAVVTVFSVVASLTPTPKKETFLGKLYSAVDFLAINLGKSKDKG